MDYWYVLIDYLLPFTWTKHLFMKNALLAVLLVGPLFAILGTMVVNNGMAFFSDTIGHSALAGIAIGVLLGFQDPLWIMIIFSILLALVISIIRYMTNIATDTVIGAVCATMVALGIVILSRGGGFNKFSYFLVGDLLSITSREILLLTVTLLGIIIIWIFMFNKLLLVSLNHSLALSRGIPVRLVETIFCVVTAVVVTISIQWVGILIINSLLILPAAAARNISKNMMQYHAVSIVITLISGLTGLIMSYYWSTATGATIVLFAALFFLASLLAKPHFS